MDIDKSKEAEAETDEIVLEESNFDNQSEELASSDVNEKSTVEAETREVEDNIVEEEEMEEGNAEEGRTDEVQHGDEERTQAGGASQHEEVEEQIAQQLDYGNRESLDSDPGDYIKVAESDVAEAEESDVLSSVAAPKPESEKEKTPPPVQTQPIIPTVRVLRVTPTDDVKKPVNEDKDKAGCGCTKYRDFVLAHKKEFAIGGAVAALLLVAFYLRKQH